MIPDGRVEVVSDFIRGEAGRQVKRNGIHSLWWEPE